MLGKVVPRNTPFLSVTVPVIVTVGVISVRTLVGPKSRIISVPDRVTLSTDNESDTENAVVLGSSTYRFRLMAI